VPPQLVREVGLAGIAVRHGADSLGHTEYEPHLGHRAGTWLHLAGRVCSAVRYCPFRTVVAMLPLQADPPGPLRAKQPLTEAGRGQRRNRLPSESVNQGTQPSRACRRTVGPCGPGDPVPSITTLTQEHGSCGRPLPRRGRCWPMRALSDSGLASGTSSCDLALYLRPADFRFIPSRMIIKLAPQSSHMASQRLRRLVAEVLTDVWVLRLVVTERP
jgi:hypothetical protein